MTPPKYTEKDISNSVYRYLITYTEENETKFLSLLLIYQFS